jgi:hypothetical protein
MGVKGPERETGRSSSGAENARRYTSTPPCGVVLDETQRLYLYLFTVTQKVEHTFRKFYVMKSSVFWDITPYNPLKLNRRFRGTSL